MSDTTTDPLTSRPPASCGAKKTLIRRRSRARHAVLCVGLGIAAPLAGQTPIEVLDTGVMSATGRAFASELRDSLGAQNLYVLTTDTLLRRLQIDVQVHVTGQENVAQPLFTYSIIVSIRGPNQKVAVLFTQLFAFNGAAIYAAPSPELRENARRLSDTLRPSVALHALISQLFQAERIIEGALYAKYLGVLPWCVSWVSPDARMPVITAIKSICQP
jgi:hypothetical protein